MSGSSWGRVWGVLVSPQRTFQSILERPSILPPLLCLVLATAAFSLVAIPKIDYGETIREALEGRNVPMDESAIDRQAAMMQRFGWAFALLGAAVFQPIGFLLVALLLWIAFKLQGSEMGFRAGFSVTLHGLMPLAVAALVSLPVALGREALTGEELQRGLLLSNLGFLAGEEAPAWLSAALRCLDFFGLWTLALLTIGFRVATRLRAGSVTATVVAMWIAWCLVKVGWAAVSAMFRG